MASKQTSGNITSANGNERFSAEAAAWDSNPDVHRASDSALQALLAVDPSLEEGRAEGTAIAKGPDVLEIGCGTGLLTLRVAPYARSITAVDAAEGMVAALQTKLDAPSAPRNITALSVLLVDPEDAALPIAREGEGRMKYDLILSHLVLHHIADLSALLRTMFGCLKAGGTVALTDYEDFGPEARRFHPESKMGGVERHGVQATWFAGLMEDAGFVDVEVRPAWTMHKDVERYADEWKDGKPQGVDLDSMDFSFLLCRGRKP